MAQAQRLSSPQARQEVFSSASQYLQDRLQERRERNTRPRRSRQSDLGPQSRSGCDDDIFIEEGDSKSSRPRLHESSPLNSGAKYASPGAQDNALRRAAGARQMDEQLDRLNKENFHLKLEIDHRRAREQQLHAEVAGMRSMAKRAETLQEEHTELLSINTQLVDELEKRDKAILEATDIILEFEDKIKEYEIKIKELEEDDCRSVTRASTIQADSGYAGTETQEAAPAPSPAHAVLVKSEPSKALAPAASATRDLNEALSSESPSKEKRRPQFIMQARPSTQALRRVYLENARQLHPVKSFQSILSRHTSTIDDDDNHASTLHSPNLSELSQSSFPSIYSPKKSSPNRYPWEAADQTSVKSSVTPGTHSRQASISRVSQWIEGHKIVMDDTPSKQGISTARTQPAESVRTISPALTTVPATYDEQYHSLNNALKDPSFDPLELLRADLPARSHTAHPISRHGSRTPTSFGGPIFGEPLLTPEHDNASQRLLRSSRSTIVGEKSITDNAPLFSKKLDTLESNLRTAPKQMRSSVELNTAFASNLEYRKTGLSNVYHPPASPSDDDDESALAIHDYLGYPDGNSILGGTPSRFLKHNNQAPFVNTPETADRRRRKSSSARATRHTKPELTRSGTSPSIPLSLKTDVSAGRGELTSPISYQSASSSNRTALGPQDARARPMSPDVLSPQRAPPSRGADKVTPSPARTLTQKTQQLFRRLSSSHGSDRVPDLRDQPATSVTPSRPALPTLTSTPSSAYVNVLPKDVRRANGVQQDIDHNSPSQSSSAAQTPPPARTPIMFDMRVNTPTVDHTVEKKQNGFFGRRGSFKGIGFDRAKTNTPVATSTRGRRRSSVKESNTPSRSRPWV